jgi:hypothetical protein
LGELKFFPHPIATCAFPSSWYKQPTESINHRHRRKLTILSVSEEQLEMTNREKMLVSIAIDAAKNCIHVFEAN